MLETQRSQTSNNRSKKNFFGIRTKLSYKNCFSENLLAIELRKTQLIMNKHVYLGLSIQ